MFELFRIGFLTVTFLDIVDILLVTLIFYKLYTVIRGTIAAQIFYGLIIVLILSFFAQAANFKALGWLLKLLSDIWVIAFIILFQPEIRRFLVLLGRTPIIRLFIKDDRSDTENIIAETAFELSQHQHGALIVIVKSVGIRGVTETGEMIDSKVSKNLLRSIFFPNSPLHDGAVIIKGDVIEAARCTLPLSAETSKEGRPLGMRHRAGIGISEQADVISVIVSEETGSISIAENGRFKTGLSRDQLRNYLTSSLKKSKENKFQNMLKNFRKRNLHERD
ncbi:MAG: diadenylate cyclase CdaA [Bacteroidetes bacterium]|nr:diadenylate cyclase CdaA [Bacteroidota bacterium]MCL6098287.1 diadenylate cyclase CdaA [Bacteroidota bacterium]